MHVPGKLTGKTDISKEYFNANRIRRRS